MDEPTNAERVADRCWSEIGVWGDSSCPELERAVHCHNCERFAAAGRSLLERASDRDYRREWTEVLTLAKETGEQDTLSVTIFRLADEWYAIPTGVVREVTEARPIRAVPHRSGGVLEGLVNIRGELLLCVSLGVLLGSGSESGAAAKMSHVVWPRIVVLERGGERWCFPADEVYGVQRIDPERLRGVPSTVALDDSSFTKGLFSWEGRNVGLLDEELLLGSLKRRVS